MPERIPVGLIGVGGRMGGALLRALSESADLRLASAVDRAGSPAVGQDAGSLAGAAATGVTIGTDLPAALRGVAVAIDFSSAQATAGNAAACAAAGVPLLIGATGQTPDALAAVERAARTVPVLVSANTSLALNVLAELVRRAAAALPGEFDIEIFEAHHRHKVDAPSGTALVLGEAAASGRGNALARPVTLTGGQTGAREHGVIGFSVARGGDVVGEHSVRFLGVGEQLNLEHVATDRAIFARGALAAARWLVGRTPGRYGMSDFLFGKQ